MIFALVFNQKAFPHGAILRANLPISYATDKEHHRHHTEVHLPSPDIQACIHPVRSITPQKYVRQKRFNGKASTREDVLSSVPSKTPKMKIEIPNVTDLDTIATGQ